ncbi:hypothetical protein A3Q56_02060 [Intoshia linei]|uniref:Uncharacterized protein n=1 Tax=Intoshia linei TaxID=1819745 RepID=A0A177B9T8_9BILA|nr:hypothetical protein A3Q56_02060 [Intoshia linei]
MENVTLVRNSTRTAGSILWSKNLIFRIEKSMHAFIINKNKLPLNDFDRITSLYIRIEKCIKTFESMWMTDWKNMVEKCKKALKSFILIQIPSNDLFCVKVNLNNRYIEIAQEYKILADIEGINLTDASLFLFLQTQNLSSNYDKLCLVIEEMRIIIKTIPDSLKNYLAIYLKHINNVFNSGLNTLSWSSLNIDAYINSIQLKKEELQQVVKEIKDSLKVFIEVPILKLEHISLMNFDECQTYKSEHEFKNDMNIQMTNNKEIIIKELTKLQQIFENGNKNPLTKFKNFINHLYTPKDNDRFSKELKKYYQTSIKNKLKNIIESTFDNFKKSLCCSLPRKTKAVANDSKKSSEFPLQIKLFGKLILLPPLIKVDPLISTWLSTFDSIVDEIYTTFLDIENSCPVVKDVTKSFKTCPSINTKAEIKSRLNVCESSINEIIKKSDTFNFLWKQNLQQIFDDTKNNENLSKKLSEKLVEIKNYENQILEIDNEIIVEPYVITLKPLQHTILTLLSNYKKNYIGLKYEQSRKLLYEAVNFRKDCQDQIIRPVKSLFELNNTLKLIEELRNRDIICDSIYKPIEDNFNEIRHLTNQISIVDVSELNTLRENWTSLMKLIEFVREELLIHNRKSFEELLDKQIKSFIVEIVSFRNSFDIRGPGKEGISPTKSVNRLVEYTKLYNKLNDEKKTIVSVCFLFGKIYPSFHELDRTGEEIELLTCLYNLYQNYINFDQIFRITLWKDINLQNASHKIDDFWDQCLALPSKLKKWKSFKNLKESIDMYRKILPILERLSRKEIVNKRWLEIMNVTNSSFLLEENVFCLGNLLNISILENKNGILKICHKAKIELEFELCIHSTEELWTEQIFIIEKDANKIHLLNIECTESILQQIEESKSQLYSIISPVHGGILANQASVWIEKLKDVGYIIELWLEVQTLWKSFDPIRSLQLNSSITKYDSNKLETFFKILEFADNKWRWIMLKALENNNVLHCCIDGDIKQSTLLNNIKEKLNLCAVSLSEYINSKRLIQPRFYYVNNKTLLIILSAEKKLEKIITYLRIIFPNLDTFSTKTVENTHKASIMAIENKTTANRPNITRHVNSETETVSFDSIISLDKEELLFLNKVTFDVNVEYFVKNIEMEIKESMQEQLNEIFKSNSNEISIETWHKQWICQVCIFGLINLWTKEAENGINELKNERKALLYASRKFNGYINKMINTLSHMAEITKNENTLSSIYELRRLNNLIAISYYYRDMMDSLPIKKIKDISDFEWKRNIRIYHNDALGTIDIECIDRKFNYGYEFYGFDTGMAFGSQFESSTFAIYQSISHCPALIVSGSQMAYKQETIKTLAYIFGQPLVICDLVINPTIKFVKDIIHGATIRGDWLLFKNIVKYDQEYSKILFNTLTCVIHNITNFNLELQKSNSCISDSKNSSTVPMTIVSVMNFDKESDNLTMNSNVAFFFMTPSSIKKDVVGLKNESYRRISLLKHEPFMLVRLIICKAGFRNSLIIASKLINLFNICQQLMPKNIFPKDMVHFVAYSIKELLNQIISVKSKSKNLKKYKTTDPRYSIVSNTEAMLETGYFTIKQELVIVKTFFNSIITTKLSELNKKLYLSIVDEIFNEVSTFKRSNVSVKSVVDLNKSDVSIFESFLKQYTRNQNLQSTDAWLEKCNQINELSNIYHGIILLGRAGTGKSTCLKAVTSALTNLNKNDTNRNHHRLISVYSRSWDSEDKMYGYINKNGKYIDGFVNTVIRKLKKNKIISWLSIDGDMTNQSLDFLNNIFEKNCKIMFKNGEYLNISNSIRIVYETDNLDNLSPKCNLGIIYFDGSINGWSSLAYSWLKKQTNYIRNVIHFNSS